MKCDNKTYLESRLRAICAIAPDKVVNMCVFDLFLKIVTKFSKVGHLVCATNLIFQLYSDSTPTSYPKDARS